MAFVPLAAAWLAISLAYSVGGTFNVAQQLGMAVFGGVAPIVLIYGVITNRRFTRIAILLTIAGNIWFYGVTRGMSLWDQILSSRILAVLFGALIGIAIYLYASKTSRAYYLLIAGKPLPESLANVDLSAPDWVAFLMRHLAGFAEWVLILLAFFIFFAAVIFGKSTIFPLGT